MSDLFKIDNIKKSSFYVIYGLVAGPICMLLLFITTLFVKNDANMVLFPICAFFPVVYRFIAKFVIKFKIAKGYIGDTDYFDFLSQASYYIVYFIFALFGGSGIIEAILVSIFLTNLLPIFKFLIKLIFNISLESLETNNTGMDFGDVAYSYANDNGGYIYQDKNGNVIGRSYAGLNGGLVFEDVKGNVIGSSFKGIHDSQVFMDKKGNIVGDAVKDNLGNTMYRDKKGNSVGTGYANSNGGRFYQKRK